MVELQTLADAHRVGITSIAYKLWQQPTVWQQHTMPKLDVDATVQMGERSKRSSHNIAFVPPATSEWYGQQ